MMQHGSACDDFATFIAHFRVSQNILVFLSRMILRVTRLLSLLDSSIMVRFLANEVIVVILILRLLQLVVMLANSLRFTAI